MLKSKILVAAFVLLFLIGCSKETKSELPKKLNQELNSKTTQQNFNNIYTAALEGDIEIIRLSIPEVLTVNSKNEDGHSLLMLASFNGHTEICEFLIKNGAHIEARDNSGRTALMFASTGPFASTVKFLLNNGANANSVDHVEKWTALMGAATEGQMEVVKLLLQNGADKNLKDIDGDTAESFAFKKNHLEVSNFLKNYTN